jgi:hypothetical protein
MASFFCKSRIALLAVALLATQSVYAEEKWVRIENRRENFPLVYIYISPNNSDDWGPDRLGGSVLNAGYNQTWTINMPGCYFDLKAVTFTGLKIEKRGVNLCGGGVWKIYDN